MIQTYTVATIGRQIDAAGNFFRYESADPSAVDQSIGLRVDGNDLGTYLPGDSIELPVMAKVWEIKPASGPATVRVGMGRITTARMVMTAPTVIKTVQSSAFANAAKTVTNASAQLCAASAGRQYLLIQNRDSNGSIFINFGAGAATASNGLKISPGGFWEFDSIVSTQAIQAIGDIASNANILVIEG